MPSVPSSSTHMIQANIAIGTVTSAARSRGAGALDGRVCSPQTVQRHGFQPQVPRSLRSRTNRSHHSQNPDSSCTFALLSMDQWMALATKRETTSTRIVRAAHSRIIWARGSSSRSGGVIVPQTVQRQSFQPATRCCLRTNTCSSQRLQYPARS